MLKVVIAQNLLISFQLSSLQLSLRQKIFSSVIFLGFYMEEISSVLAYGSSNTLRSLIVLSRYSRSSVFTNSERLLVIWLALSLSSTSLRPNKLERSNLILQGISKQKILSPFNCKIFLAEISFQFPNFKVLALPLTSFCCSYLSDKSRLRTFFILHSTSTAHLHSLLKVFSSIQSLSLMEEMFLMTQSENFRLMTRMLRESEQKEKIRSMRPVGKSKKATLISFFWCWTMVLGFQGKNALFMSSFRLNPPSFFSSIYKISAGIFFVLSLTFATSLTFFVSGWLFFNATIFDISSSKFSLLALLIKICEFISLTSSTLDTSTPFIITFSVFSKNQRVSLPYSMYFLCMALSLASGKIKISSSFWLPKGCAVSNLFSALRLMSENLDFFLPLICRLFLVIMHSHLIENSWRQVTFIIFIILISNLNIRLKLACHTCCNARH